jgi:hypothetical protein
MSTTEPTPKQATNQAPAASPNLRLVNNTLVALAVIATGAWLFTNGNGTVGGALIGMVAAHYFSQVHGQAASDQLQQAVAAVGQLMKPPSGGA